VLESDIPARAHMQWQRSEEVSGGSRGGHGDLPDSDGYTLSYKSPCTLTITIDAILHGYFPFVTAAHGESRKKVICMKKHEVFESVPGILRPFKTFIEEMELKKGDQIVYYGVPGTCTPFVELLAFAIRTLPVEQVFVPLVDEAKAARISLVPNVGMQMCRDSVSIGPQVVVLMGGLSMPNSGVTAQQVQETISTYGAPLIGVCFMKMFDKTGWLKTFDFSLLIDANIAPVDVWKESRDQFREGYKH
jgi:hypothetical protein